MDITYIGHSCFKLRGKSGTVITDPFDQSVGIPFPNVSGDIVTISHDHPDHNAASRVVGTARRKEPFVVNECGEYEILDIAVTAVPSFHDSQNGSVYGNNRVTRVRMDGVTLVHLGDIGHQLSDSQLSALGVVNVLFIPVGGHVTIDAKHAIEMVEAIEPSIVIPMHFMTEKYAQGYRDLATVEVFLKEMGKEGILPQEKLSVSGDSLPGELNVVYLTPSADHGDSIAAR